MDVPRSTPNFLWGIRKVPLAALLRNQKICNRWLHHKDNKRNFRQLITLGPLSRSTFSSLTISSRASVIAQDLRCWHLGCPSAAARNLIGYFNVGTISTLHEDRCQCFVGEHPTCVTCRNGPVEERQWVFHSLLGVGEYSVSNIWLNCSLFVIHFDLNAGIRYFWIIWRCRIGSQSQKPRFLVKPSEISSHACRKTPPMRTFFSSVPSCCLALRFDELYATITLSIQRGHWNGTIPNIAAPSRHTCSADLIQNQQSTV